MSDDKRGPHTFTGVCVYKSDHVYVSAIADELPEDEDHALIFRWLETKWAHRPLTFAVGSMCSVEEPRPLVMAMGITGEINLFTNPGRPGAATETVDTSDDGPSPLTPLKSIRSIGRHVYVAGLARRVYRRDADNIWTAIDRDAFAPRGRRSQAVGFNAIDGISEESLYAVGYKGEIWFYDGAGWTLQESPTNVTLTCVRCASASDTFAGGMAGTLLHGSNGGWEVIEQSVTQEDFWGMALFAGKLYVANYDGVFLLVNGTLTPVEIGHHPRVTTAYLDSNDGVLWSVGHKDLAFTRDGAAWTVVAPPD